MGHGTRALIASIALGACGTPPAPRVANHAAGTLTMLVRAQDHFAIATIDRSGVRVMREVPFAGGDAAWLDAHTIVAWESRRSPPRLRRFVDAVEVETLELDETWASALLMLRDDREVWLDRCTEPRNDLSDCPQEIYHRFMPASSGDTTVAPRGSNGNRIVGYEGDWYTKYPEVTAPRGARLDVTADGHATCTRDGQTSAPVPGPEYVRVAMKSARWIYSDPPIYELQYDADPSDGNMFPHHEFFRPCNDQLRGFMILDRDLWAELVDESWVVRVGTREIGRVTGVGMLAAP